MIDLFGNENSGALFSEDRLHRYKLWRIWDAEKPLIMFIGLNPSKANEVKGDPTIRCVGDFADRWGYGGFYMTNLYSLVSPNPEDLITCDDPVRDNDQHLAVVASLCLDVVFAWGKFKMTESRSTVAKNMFPDALCIGKKDGQPYHPLWAGMWAPAAIKATFTHPVKFYNGRD